MKRQIPCQFVLTLTLVFLVFAGQALAEFSRADLDVLQKKLQSSECLRVDMVQKKTSPSRPNRPVVVKGHALFQKPDRFRWVLGEPINEETIFNGKDLI